MIETINGKAYLKVGDKVYELGGGSNIITADSVEQLPDPASVPEGTIALVKSEGESGGGLPVVEIDTVISLEEVELTQEESAKLTEQIGKPTFIQFTARIGDMEQTVSACFMYTEGQFMLIYGGAMFRFSHGGDSWSGVVVEA